MSRQRISFRKPKESNVAELQLWLRVLGFVLDILIIYYLVVPIVNKGLGYLSNLFPTLTQGFENWGEGKTMYSLSRAIMFLIIIVHLVTFIFHTSILECSKLRSTFGNFFLKLKVSNLDGSKLSFIKAFIRALLKLISIVSFFGVWMIDLNKNRQALHDKICGTIVRRNQ